MDLVVGYIYSNSKNDMARDVELRVQKEKIIQACKDKKWLIDAIYQEFIGEGPTPRMEFVRMLHDMYAEKIKIIVVFSLDNLGNLEEIKDVIDKNCGHCNYNIYSVLEDKLYDLSFEENETARKLKEVESKIRDIPSLPEVVTRVMNLVQDPSSSAEKLGKVIACDPGLTSRVLRLVNSAYYGFPRQISSIQQAIAMVGFTTVRGLVLSSSIFRIFTPKSSGERTFDYKKFWKHCLMTSVAAKHINKYLYNNEDENLFSAAMLHDIGKIILDQYDHENYIQAYNSINDIFDDELLLVTERRHCKVAHTEIGSFVAQKWNLPDTIANSILYHHNPSLMRDLNPTVVIVYMANIFANAYLEKVDVFFEMFDSYLMEIIKLDKEAIDKLSKIINDKLDEVGHLESFEDDTI